MSALQPVSRPRRSISRPALLYHGGKFRLAPWVVGFFPPHRVYVEPFGGGASVLLSKRPSGSEIYNDLDGHIVNVFRVLRDPGRAKELQRRLKLTAFARSELEWSYEEATDDVDAAHKILVRSWLGHGSDSATRRHRSGLRGPSGDARRSRALPSREWAGFPALIPEFTARLAGVWIEEGDYRQVVSRFDGPDTLFYVDPPYLLSVRTAGAGRSKRDLGYRHEMTDADHVALAGVLRACAGMVVVSGYPSDLYDGLFADWRRVSRPAAADCGARRVECLWLSPSCHIPCQGDLFELRLSGAV